MEMHGIIRGFDIISYSTCSKTKELFKIKSRDLPNIKVTSADDVTYVVPYKGEKIL